MTIARHVRACVILSRGAADVPVVVDGWWKPGVPRGFHDVEIHDLSDLSAVPSGTLAESELSFIERELLADLNRQLDEMAAASPEMRRFCAATGQSVGEAEATIAKACGQSAAWIARRAS